MTISDECSALLGAAGRFGPLYANGLSNHLPMGLIALDRMGAAPADLRRFYDAQSRPLERLAPALDGAAIAPAPGDAAHGDFPAYLDYFAGRFDVLGADALLREWLPRLMPGVGAAAFHALIRLAYAVEADHRAELCHALAFWSIEFAELDLSPRTTTATIAEIARALVRETAASCPLDGTIADKMLCMARHSALRKAAIQPAVLALPEIAAFSLAAFADRDDFTLLHLLTSTHALRLVLPYCDDEQAALRYFWQAALVAYLTVPQMQTQTQTHTAAAPDSPGMHWDGALSRALRCDDAHTIKLIYSASCEYRHYRDERYLDVVRRRLGGAG